MRSLAHSPLFQVMFAWQNARRGQLSTFRVWRLRPLQSSSARCGQVRSDALACRKRTSSIAGGIEYATALFEPATIERYLEYFRTSAAKPWSPTTPRPSIGCHCCRRRAASCALRVERDADGVSRRTSASIELFEEQVARTPDAVAVVFEEKS